MKFDTFCPKCGAEAEVYWNDDGYICPSCHTGFNVILDEITLGDGDDMLFVTLEQVT